VPVAVDQDPHVRVCRDVAGKERYDVREPGDLLARFVPALDGEGKMSSSAAGGISPADDPDEIRAAVMGAYSGGRATVADHRDRGGDPTVDVAFRFRDDERERLGRRIGESTTKEP